MATVTSFRRPLMAATTQQLIDFYFERGLQHFARSLAQDHLCSSSGVATRAVGAGNFHKIRH
jgi:hypothetical protein